MPGSNYCWWSVSTRQWNSSTWVLDGITDRMKLVAAMLILSQCLSRIYKFKAWAFSRKVFQNYQFSIIMRRCGSMEGLSVISKTTDRKFYCWKFRGINTALSIISHPVIKFRDTRWCSWLRHCATSRKINGSIPNVVNDTFHGHNPSDRTMVLGLTQPLTEMSTRSISWG
jgi:hypothetical protein